MAEGVEKAIYKTLGICKGVAKAHYNDHRALETFVEYNGKFLAIIGVNSQLMEKGKGVDCYNKSLTN